MKNSKYRIICNQEGLLLCSFSFCEFLLEGFSRKVFNEATYAIQLRLICTFFPPMTVFPAGFSDEVFNEAYAFAVIAQGGVL